MTDDVRRSLTESERMVLEEVQSYWGPHNSEDDLFFPNPDEAYLFATDREGKQRTTVGITWLAKEYDSGAKSLEAVRAAISGADIDHSSEDEAQTWFELKSRLMQKTLGREHDSVMHAIVPYAVGGPLDIYFYPHGIPGTAIATKELSELPNQGSSNDEYRSYELVMFTRHPFDPDAVDDERSAFRRAYRSITAILNLIARYSADAKLNPFETCEFPAEMEHIGGRSLIFDGYACHSEDQADRFGLLAVIEILRSEMEFARQHGGDELIARLKSRGVYPYSDLDRDPVA